MTPAVIFVVLAFWSDRVWLQLRGTPPADALTIDLVAYQFGFHIRNPGADGQLGAYDQSRIKVGDNNFGLDLAHDDPAGHDDYQSENQITLPVNKAGQLHPAQRGRDPRLLRAGLPHVPGHRAGDDDQVGVVHPGKGGPLRAGLQPALRQRHYNMQGQDRRGQPGRLQQTRGREERRRRQVLRRRSTRKPPSRPSMRRSWPPPSPEFRNPAPCKSLPIPVPSVKPQSEEHPAEHVHQHQGIFRTYLWSHDHKMIAKQYLLASMFFGAISGLLAMALRWQLGFPGKPMPSIGHLLALQANSAIVNPDGSFLPGGYNMLVTMHATVMVFFVIMPLLIGVFGNFLIRSKSRAPDMAFPFFKRTELLGVLPLGLHPAEQFLERRNHGLLAPPDGQFADRPIWAARRLAAGRVTRP